MGLNLFATNYTLPKSHLILLCASSRCGAPLPAFRWTAATFLARRMTMQICFHVGMAMHLSHYAFSKLSASRFPLRSFGAYISMFLFFQLIPFCFGIFQRPIRLAHLPARQRSANSRFDLTFFPGLSLRGLGLPVFSPGIGDRTALLRFVEPEVRHKVHFGLLRSGHLTGKPRKERESQCKCFATCLTFRCSRSLYFSSHCVARCDTHLNGSCVYSGWF